MSANQSKKTGSQANAQGNHSWNPYNPWQNYGENWSRAAANPFDFNAFRQTASRNMQTLTAANQVALEGAQAISRLAADVLQQNTQQSWECFRDACQSSSSSDIQNLHTNCASNLLQNSFESLREATQIASRAAMEVVDLVNKRTTESLHEWNTTFASSRSADKQAASN